jgi:alpha-glucosidase (family GH31 glycosyl hydrolase)
MDGRKDFTIDPVNFADLPALVDEVKQGGLRFGIILDPAIAHERKYNHFYSPQKNERIRFRDLFLGTGYPTFRRGDSNKVFVQWANSSYKPDDQDANDNNLYGRVSRASYAITREKTISQAYPFFVQ